MIVIHLKENGLSPRKASWHCMYSIYTVAIALLMDQNKVLVSLFPQFYQLDLVLKLNFVSDNIILTLSQSNVNITIDTKIHPITSLHTSNQTKLINSSYGNNN